MGCRAHGAKVNRGPVCIFGRNMAKNIVLPPFLKKGSRIALCATARKVKPTEVLPMVEALRDQGFEVVLPDELYAEHHQFGGTDHQRASLFQNLIDDPTINAILIVRGGYGSVRMIDQINWTAFAKNPKWVIGFSDVTVLHAHIYSQVGVATLHADMIPQFLNKGAHSRSFRSIIEALRGCPAQLEAANHPLNKTGMAQGPLVGGNLSIIYSLLGSASATPTKGALLFIEDLDEYLYHIDRMMMNLSRNNMLDHLAGVVVGGLTDMHDNPIAFGQTAEEIVRSYFDHLNIPVAFGLPIGHTTENWAVVHGAIYTLEVSETGTVLKECLPIERANSHS